MKNPLLTTLFSLLLATSAFATHLRAGQITVRQDPSNNFMVWITIVIYTNTINTNVLFGGEDDILDFGDGQTMFVPETPNTFMPDLGEGVAMASFTVSHTYQKHGPYLISYSEPNRNEGVLNLDGSVNTRFYTETYITLKPGTLYRTPEPELPPVFTFLLPHQLTLSLACIDSMGNKLRYQLVPPNMSRDLQVNNYQFPENCFVNYYSGLMSWDAKFEGHYREGEYAFAVKISQFDNENNLVGYMVRDFQIILNDILDSDPGIKIEANGNEDENGRIYVPENETSEIRIIASASGPETDADSIYIVSELLSIPGALTVATYDSTDENNVLFKIAKLSLKNIPAIVRNNPYSISVRISFRSGYRLFSTSDLAYLFHTKEIESSPPGIVGSEEQLNRNIEVYPNPFHERLFTNVKNGQPAYIEIIDLNGRSVFKNASLPESIDMSTAMIGSYLLIIKQNGKAFTTKVIKK